MVILTLMLYTIDASHCRSPTSTYITISAYSKHYGKICIFDSVWLDRFNITCCHRSDEAMNAKAHLDIHWLSVLNAVSLVKYPKHHEVCLLNTTVEANLNSLGMI